MCKNVDNSRPWLWVGEWIKNSRKISQKSSMIHSATPTVWPAIKIFVLLVRKKWDGRTCVKNHHYKTYVSLPCGSKCFYQSGCIRIYPYIHTLKDLMVYSGSISSLWRVTFKLLKRLQSEITLRSSCKNNVRTSLANLRWPTRLQPIGSHYFHAWRPLYRVFYVSVVARFCFSDGQTDGRTYGRTDTTCENNDHLFGRGLVG